MRDVLVALRQGLVTPSGRSVGTMLVTLVVCAVASAGLLGPVMASPAADLLSSHRTDHDLFATAAIHQLDDGEQPRPLLAIMGASATRASFGENDLIAADLAEVTGTAYQVVDLETGRQTLLEHLQLLDSLPTDRDVLIVLGLGPSRLTWDRQEYAEIIASHRLGVGSPAFDDQLADLGLPVPRRTGVDLLDQRRFYAPRIFMIPRNLVRLALGAPISQDENQYLGRVRSEASFAEHSTLVMSRFDDGRSPSQASLELLDRFLMTASQRPRTTVVVIEHPINPVFVQDYYGATAYQEHLARIRSLATEAAVPYWTLARDAELGPEVFFDWAHLNDRDAQRQLRRMLVTRLADLVDRTSS